LARASPGKLNYGTPGIGTPVHLAGALFASMAGINVVPVPYKGAAEYTAALLGNEVQLVFACAPTALPHVRTGARRALGVTTARRIAPLPDVPTIAESGFPGYDIMSWYGVLAPAGTPHDIVARLAKEIGAATRTKKFGDALPDYEMIGNTPAAFAEFLRKDAEVSARIIAQAGAKAHGPPGSFGLDPGIHDDLRKQGDLVVHEGQELLRGVGARLRTLAEQHLAHVFLGHPPNELAVQLRDDRRRRTRRR